MGHGQEQRGFQDSLNVMKPYFVVCEDTKDYPITPDQRNLRITTPAAAGTADIIMPPVEECAGLFFYGRCVSAGGGEVTIKDALGNDILGDALSALADVFLLFSTGMEWDVIHETTT